MKQKYKVLDLFSGLGGFSLGLERTGHFETVAFCDNDKFSKAILDKHWKGIKVYDDVREITKEKFKEDGIEFPDIITGGFPCQPFSVAGKQKGTSDDRHLWPEMFRIIKAFKPRFVIGENVRGIVNIQDGVVFETVCTNLEDEGYEVQPFNIPAAAVGAPHRRERIWFIAVREEPMVDSDNIRFEQHSTTTETTSGRGTSATSQSTSSSSPRSNVANTVGEYEGREISRSDEETRGIQEEHRQNNSATGQSSRTSEVRNGSNGYENVADTENGRGQPSQSERWQGTERGSINSRGIEREGQDPSPTTDRINVADTNDEGVRTRIGGSDNDHETESRIGGADGEGGSSDVERNNSTSTKVEGMDVADTESIRTREPREFDQAQRSEGSGSTQLDGSSKNDANSNEEGLQGFRQSRNQLNKRFSLRSEGSEGEHGTVGQGWWSVEPNVGRVAHGVPGRVYRLKGLGNSIVPQIVEEIGYALIKAERE